MLSFICYDYERNPIDMSVFTKKYLDNVSLLYQKYILHGEPPPDEMPSGIRPEIWDSWMISLKNGVDCSTVKKHPASPEQFSEILKQNRKWLKIAIPHIETIYSFIKGSNYIIHITSADGCMLKYYGDDGRINDLFRNAELCEGSVRREELSGTDSASLCLRLDRPVQVIGPEHFLQFVHAFVCSSAPIHDSSGRLLGVLTIVGPKELYHNHTLGMAYSAAKSIESDLQKAEYYESLKYTNALLKISVEESSSAIILLDSNYEILQYNRLFINYFRLSGNDHSGSSLFTVFPEKSFPEDLVFPEKTVADYSFTAKSVSGAEIDAIASVKVILQNNATMYLMSFEKQKNIRALAGKYLSPITSFTFDSLIGNSDSFKKAKDFAVIASESMSNVLILGESGTGKELFAQAIHNASDRSHKPFIAVNCGSIPRNLVESELFGYEKGAFTGAKTEGHPGKFELADGGTLFLDEIGDMPLEIQASLLRVLQSKEITKVGGSTTKKINVRIIAATNADLEASINNNTFRADLYYRLNVLTIKVPPLRERRSDIAALVYHFTDLPRRRL